MEDFLKYNITQIGSFTLSVYTLVITAVTLLVMVIVLVIIKRVIYRVDKFDKGKQYAIYRLLKYFIVVITLVLLLNNFGIDVTVFIAGSAALLVGLGLGLQGLFNDFISGIELLIEGSVTVNDVIEVEGIVAKVVDIGLRTSYVLTRDGVYIIIPNSTLTSNKLINWTHSEVKSRFHITCGVAYGTDVDKAIKIMKDSGLKHPQVTKEPEPFVRLSDFGDSGVIMELLFWSNEVFGIDDVKSKIRVDIYKEFRAAGIEIPFPQRTLSFKPGDLEKISKGS
jgi:small-conductance mechanosensitive channel